MVTHLLFVHRLSAIFQRHDAVRTQSLGDILGSACWRKSDRRGRGIRRDITATRELVIKIEKSIV